MNNIILVKHSKRQHQIAAGLLYLFGLIAVLTVYTSMFYYGLVVAGLAAFGGTIVLFSGNR